MVIEYVRYRIAENDRQEFEEAYARAGATLAEAPNCLGFELTRCVEDPGAYTLRIRWDSVDGHLDGFRKSDEFTRFFADVRPYVDHVEEMRHYEPTGVEGPGGGEEVPPTLYEWGGGEAAFKRLFSRFYEAVVVDPLLEPLFGEMSPDHPDHVALWLGEVFGGPPAYTEHHGGYENMLAHHMGKAITEPQRRRWVELLVDAADEVELPADPEFRSAFMAYVEWGTRLAVENSEPGASPPPRAPVPRWGWGMAPPWQG